MALLFSSALNPSIISNPNPSKPLIFDSPSSSNLFLLSQTLHFPRSFSLSAPKLSSSVTSSSSLRFLQVDDEGSSPWENALVYRRDPSVSHLEYCTTLERLGLEKLSSELSRSRASDLGLRVTRAVKDYRSGTPVQISLDVLRKKKKLRLDGVLRTVISLGCNRCGEPATECIYSNFTLLLTEEPIEEPEQIFMGTIYGEDKLKMSSAVDEGENDGDSLDLDDQLYFPAEDKEIDISKNIRDLIHVEITYNAICDPSCKGLCLKCGTNLNKRLCSCRKEDARGKDMVASKA